MLVAIIDMQKCQEFDKTKPAALWSHYLVTKQEGGQGTLTNSNKVDRGLALWGSTIWPHCKADGNCMPHLNRSTYLWTMDENLTSRWTWYWLSFNAYYYLLSPSLIQYVCFFFFLASKGRSKEKWESRQQGLCSVSHMHPECTST